MAWCILEGNTLAWKSSTFKTEASTVKLILQQETTVKVRKAITRLPQTMTLYEGAKPTETTYSTIQTIETFQGKKQTVTLKKGQTLLLDFGQNLVGWIVFTAKGREGTTVYVKPGEMLNDNSDPKRLNNGPAGSIWRYNLMNAAATETYILTGKEKGEPFSPAPLFTVSAMLKLLLQRR